MRKRVCVALGLLAGAKVLNVGVPFLFKYAVDHLNKTLPATAAGDAYLNMASAPDTVLTVATSLLIGCKFLINIIYSTFDNKGKLCSV